MDIKRAKEEIKNTVRMYLQKDEEGHYRIPQIRQRPLFLIGAPGIGKTAILEQAAKECGVALVAYTITHHTRQSAVGLPFIRERQYGGKAYSVTEYTMSEIIASVYEKMEEAGKHEGILFLDEINCVSETLAPTMLQFLQAKTFGNTRLPEGWIVVTAGNPPEYNKSVREFDVATLDRVKYMRVEPDFGVWKEYAYERHIHGSILTYLEIKKENFYHMETAVDGKHFVTARGWEDLSVLLYSYEELGLQVDADVVGQYLQERSAAVDFANFLELYRRYEEQYRVADILAGGDTALMRQRMAQAAFDERVSLVSMLLSGLNAWFAEWYGRECYTEEVFGWLKEWKRRMEPDGIEAGAALEEIVEAAGRQQHQEQAGGLLSREEEKRKEQVASTLQGYLYRLKAEATQGMAGTTQEGGGGAKETAFSHVRSWFGEELAQRDARIRKISDGLSGAFRFLEQSQEADREELSDGPEMIYFVTGLESSGTALRFIQENGCEAFYRHSRSLFSDETRSRLLGEMDQLR